MTRAARRAEATSGGPARAVVDRLPALGSPVFRRFLGGAMIASIGSFMQGTAQGWLVLGLTNSAAALGVVSALQILPVLVLSPFAGVVADRLDRRRLLAATQLSAAVCALVLAILATMGIVQFWHVAVIAVVAGSANAMQNPAYQAIVPSLVGRAAIGSAVALNSAQFNLSRILGPTLAGMAIAAGGLGLAFWANAFALLAVAAIFWRLRPVTAQPTPVLGASMWSNLVDGLRYVRSRRILAALVLLAAVPGVFLLNYLMLLPVFARDVLDIGATGLGLLSAAIGAGALAGAIGLAAFRPSGGSGRSLLMALVVAAAAEIVFAVSRVMPVSMVALAVLGASQVLYYATTNTLLQVLVPGRLRGRVMSLYILTSWGLIPFGNLLAGAVAERSSATLAIAAGSAITLGATLAAAVLVPELRGLQAGSGAAEARAETFVPAGASEG